MIRNTVSDRAISGSRHTVTLKNLFVKRFKSLAPPGRADAGKTGAHAFRPILKRVVLSVKDALFPLKCLACDRLFLREPEIDALTEYGRETALVLCSRCRGDVQMMVSPVCSRCGMMFIERFSDDHLCGVCLTRPGKIHFARSLAAYNRSLQVLIQAFKFRGKLQAAKPLGRLLLSLYRQHYGVCSDNGCPDLVIPVPLHKKRFRKRGFNQAWMMIRQWPVWMGHTSSQDKPACIKDGLIRSRWTETQTGLDRKSRRSNLKGAFSLSPQLDVQGKHVLLIDDVYTTGATAEECAAVLSKNGALRIDILTVARTLEPGWNTHETI